jgi:cobalt-zinc-cadmium efflux system protein
MGRVESATARHLRALRLVFGLTLGYFLVEVVAGILTNSLALLADAAHMLTDTAGLGLALFASWIAQRPAPPSKTYGYYRAEILAALTNAVVLFLISIYILYEAYRRLQDPPEVASLPMLIVASVGLLVNLIGLRMLHAGAQESLNVRGAFLEVLGDALGSLGVLAAGVIMLTTSWYYADPLFSVFIGVFILPRTWRLLTQAVNVLLEGAPPHVDVEAVRQALLGVEGVTDVHDLHIWTITSGLHALSAHVVLKDEATSEDAQRVLERIHALLKERFDIDHTTIQIEQPSRSPREPSL